VVLCGWMTFLVVPPAWNERIINIHPSLLPHFGGQGMYGIHVHRAVLAAGVRETGCTVHFVDGEYDHGRIILQKKVWVDPRKDTPEMLQARVQVLEREAYPEAINLLASGKVAWPGSPAT
jgi:phosphoribosylglycinamide formyltransferase-1